MKKLLRTLRIKIFLWWNLLLWKRWRKILESNSSVSRVLDVVREQQSAQSQPAQHESTTNQQPSVPGTIQPLIDIIMSDPEAGELAQKLLNRVINHPTRTPQILEFVEMYLMYRQRRRT